ncbi:EAL domain, c-di-GMP-specific phosphodiesterase class I (or its enzymatically inactive variant) [Devosia limi DSM 17137]|uniref:EAL domain, c-di-GMP-specific phosphodiesterase class I (Or its enzymatically inactive variant) n=2 Tax=Devosia TaxID=46913 RepID=A0A1M4TKV5_9HYPH|nr:EAL domain, c-di-GMP-specific phosphodiesterase class I (or its enzymatically inactive variant) [Devosia limi DSM 17137]
MPLEALLQPNAAAMALIGRYDHVTRLPNRLQFIEQFPALLSPRTPQTLMLVTLAEARHYNEMLRALGMAFAEDFVRAGADLLASLLPYETRLFHVSVLSFALVLDVDDTAQIPVIAAVIAAAFAGAIEVEAIPVKTQVGVGLLPLSVHADGTESLRAALVAAQDSRRIEPRLAFYNHQTDAAHLRAFRILADLPGAIATAGQLSLHYQPRIQLASGACHGAEALLRWHHPELGPISPAEFVPLAEQTALIAPLTDWVIDTALRQNRQFLDAGHDLRISINASPVNVAEAGFDDQLLHRCDAAGLAPHHVELEFTEGTLATNSARTIAQLSRLRGAGINVALDDFGSGYSNLSYLARIPADVLKIDQSFVRPLIAPGDNDFLLRHIVSMAQGLGFRVCAEGIETAHAYGVLRELGCEEGQGYHMARPMPAPQFADWLAVRP